MSMSTNSFIKLPKKVREKLARVRRKDVHSKIYEKFVRSSARNESSGLKTKEFTDELQEKAWPFLKQWRDWKFVKSKEPKRFLYDPDRGVPYFSGEISWAMENYAVELQKDCEQQPEIFFAVQSVLERKITAKQVSEYLAGNAGLEKYNACVKRILNKKLYNKTKKYGRLLWSGQAKWWLLPEYFPKLKGDDTSA